MTKPSSYRALQAIGGGVLEPVDRATPTPGVGEVLLAVEACGICGADASTIEGNGASPAHPRVPGHEVVGRIVTIGPGNPSHWRHGQRVGVGRLGGHCGECRPCRGGLFHLCAHQPVVGSTQDGGYAGMMLARGTGLVAIPDEFSAVDAAPLLCAGLATFNALKKCGAEAGDVVAILGIGGLGHLAIQYARRMGFKVVAIGRGADIADDVRRLGAHAYIDTHAEDAAAVLRAMGGAQAILSTVMDSAAASALIGGLAPQGRLMLLGVGKEPLPVLPGMMVGGERVIQGSITGTPLESEKTLAFSLLADIRANIQTWPLERALEAYHAVRSGQVKFRAVLTVQ